MLLVPINTAKPLWASLLTLAALTTFAFNGPLHNEGPLGHNAPLVEYNDNPVLSDKSVIADVRKPVAELAVAEPKRIGPAVDVIHEKQHPEPFAAALTDSKQTKPRVAIVTDGRPIPESFRFLHIPKTGTSFIIVLRNYLDACPVKHFSCPGVPGGGGDFINNDSGKREKSLFSFNVTQEEMTASRDCGGKLVACGAPAPNPRHSHLPWRNKEKEVNVVTMLRDPLSRLISHYSWLRGKKDSLDERLKDFNDLIEHCLEDSNYNSDFCPLFATKAGLSQSAINMLSGYFPETKKVLNENDFLRAKTRLFNEIIFYGITDRWDETVCTFHCEFGGEALPSEFINTRDNGQVQKEQLTALLTPKVKAWLDQVQARENKLFDEANSRFEARAKKCGCLGYKQQKKRN